MTKKRVLIAGSGPSAALAVLAAADVGAEYTVMSATDPTQRPPGAFFLHWLPPSLRAMPVEVLVDSVGNEAVYAYKQWGCGYSTSFPKHQAVHSWYPAECLAQVWTSTHVEITKLNREDLAHFSREYDWVFYTWALGDNVARGIPVHVLYTPTEDRPTILYNGKRDVPWCRQTRAFGEVHTEYPYNYSIPQPQAEGWTMVADLPPWANPVTDLVAPNVVPIGRLARQDSKYLAHQAYEEVLRCLTQ